MLYEKMIFKMRIETELHGIFMLHFLILYTVTVQYVRYAYYKTCGSIIIFWNRLQVKVAFGFVSKRHIFLRYYDYFFTWKYIRWLSKNIKKCVKHRSCNKSHHINHYHI